MSSKSLFQKKVFNGYVSVTELLSWVSALFCYFFALLLFTLPHKIEIWEKILLSFASMCLLFGQIPILERKRTLNSVLQFIGVVPWALLIWVSDSYYCLVFVHLAVIPACFKKTKDDLGFHFLPKSLKITLLGFCISVLLHTLSCSWILIYPSPEETALTSYIKAFYWLTSTLTTIGYGDITPTSNGGRIFTIFVMFLGATSFGIVIASFARLMAASDKRTELKNDKLRSLAELFKHYEIPKILQNQVVGFCHHMYSQKIFADEEAVLQELPAPLRNELEVFMNIKPISKIAIFRNCSIDCLKYIAQKLTQEFFEPGQKIINHGQVGNEMFLIGHGTVGIHMNEKKVAILEHGQCFGEIALIQHTTRTADVVAETYCSVFKLSRESFEESILKYPELKKNVDHIILARQDRIYSSTGNLRKNRRNSA